MTHVRVIVAAVGMNPRRHDDTWTEPRRHDATWTEPRLSYQKAHAGTLD